TADELGYHFSERAAIRHATLDSFGYQLRFGLGLFLRVAIARSFAHGANRSHAAIHLEAAALIENDFTGRFFGAGEKPSNHHHITPGGDCFRHVAGEFHTAIGDDWHA